MRLPYDERGDGPAVVLLHAGVCDRRMWSEHLAPLADAGYRAVALDLPGFGDAPLQPGAAGGMSPWDDVLETMDGLGIDRAALVGVSWGGGVALRTAVVAPERVSALCLVSARPFDDAEASPQLQAAFDAEVEAAERGDFDGAVAAVLSAWTLPDASDELRARVAAMERRGLELDLAAPEASDGPDPLDGRPDAVGQIDVPALVMVGEHDMVDFHTAASELASALPGAPNAVVVAGAGHLAPMETPERFRELLLELLAQA